MWAYDDGRGRRTRDIPSSRPANYYDDAYERAPPRSSRHAYPEPQPKQSSNDRHRRKSAMVDPEGPRPRRNTHGGVNVVASDDGSGYPYGGEGARDVYGSAYPGKKSRHDVEHKTGDRDRRFREKRGTWETDEAENLRRAKSYSPRRAAREAEAPRRVSPQAPKPTWPEDNNNYAAQAGSNHHHRSSKKGTKAPPPQYYDDDPYASYYASQAPPRSSKKPDRGGGGGGGGAASAYDWGAPPPSSADDMPRPPMGEHAPYKSSPLGSSYPEAGEKPGKHHHHRRQQQQRDKDYYGGGGYDDYAAPKAGTNYYGAEEATPRRSRHGKQQQHDDRAAGMDEYGQAAQPQPRGRHRTGDYGDAADPYSYYDRAAPPPQQRVRHRQSMPPQPRAGAAADDPYADTDPYGQAPRRRATSVNYGRGQRDRYGGDPYYDDGYGARGGGSPSGSGGSGGAVGGAGGKKGNRKGKAYAQQAGKLFMTHAVPVIKKEAVPFLTKAAQAYFEQQKR